MCARSVVASSGSGGARGGGDNGPLAANQRYRRSGLPIGELLEGMDLVTSDQLAAALDQQRNDGGRLGEILVANGSVSDTDLARALSVRFRVEFVDLDDITIDPAVASILRPQFARTRQVLPMSQADGEVVVAMANPIDVFTIDDIKSAAGARVVPVMAEAKQIAFAIDRVYGAEDHEEILRVADTTAPDLISTVADEDEIVYVGDSAHDAPIIQFVDQLIARAIAARASDIHLEPTRGRALRVRHRIDGVLQDVMVIPANLRQKITSRVKLLAHMDIAEKRLAQDGRVSVMIRDHPVSLRVVTLPTPHGEVVVLRVLEESTGLLKLSQLGFEPEALKRYETAFRRPWGAILVTGPTGSGKSTTLYATLAEINDPGRNIVTVEDPIEYQLDGIKQVQLNTKAGMKFATALRAILRADPDVVLVGEMRDVETSRIGIEAALTGHLMLTSLHTNSAAATPMRLVDMGIEPFLVTSTVTGVVAQRLARRLCAKCKAPYTPTKKELTETFGRDSDMVERELFKPIGCTACSDTGYRGRIAIQEVMLATREVNELILERASVERIEKVAVDQGMMTLRRDGLRKAAHCLTSVHEVYRAIG